MMSLKFLFIAQFVDGSSIIQTQEDQSTTDPQKSAFYDVLQRESELAVFGLYSDNHNCVVDLRTGKFTMDGVNFFTVQDPSVRQSEDILRRLVYFRKVTRNFNPANMEEISVHLAFHIGFQFNDKDGTNHQVTIAVD